MKFPLFKRIGIFFVPISVMGWLILVLAVVGVVLQFYAIDLRSHSVSDTLMNFAYRLLIDFAGYSLFAWLTSSVRKPRQ